MTPRNRFLSTLAATLLATAAQAAPPAPVASPNPKSILRMSNAPKGASLLRAQAPELTPETSKRAEAFALLRQGDRAQALSAFRAATVQEPGNPLVWRFAGDLLYAQGEEQEASETWQAGADLHPSDWALLERLLRGAMEAGDYPRGASAAGRMANLLLSDSAGAGDARIEAAIRQHLSMQSELATLAGDFTQAEDAARRLMKHAPTELDGRLALAYMHLQASELTDAEDLYLEILAVDPHQPTALNNLGNIHYLNRDLDGAAQRFEAILELEATPYSESLALSNLAELFQLKGEFVSAEGLYRQAIDTRPEGAWGYMGLAALFDVTGRYDQAVDAMIDGWERDSNRMTRLNMHFVQPEWLWQRDALISEVDGDQDQAETLWSRVLQGDVVELHKAAAWHLAALKDDQ